MNKTVLVVDDIAANRSLLGEALEPKGYEVLLAPNGAAALKVTERAAPHLILLDVNMPDLDGYQTCRRLKANPDLAPIPVIFITANDDPESLVKGFEAGGVDYITKPFKEQEVLMRVETHLKIHTLTRALEESNHELAQKNAELESEVRRRQEAEDQANRANQAKTQFLSFISHEMRTPLNAIIGFSEELVDALTDETLAQSRGDAAHIRSASGHLLGLINNLLDLSKIEAGKMPVHFQELDLDALVKDLSEEVAPVIRKNRNQLEVHSANGFGRVTADPTQLKQILLNLISNAAKFTQDGRIRMEMFPAADLPAKPAGPGALPGTQSSPVTGIAIRVTDTGIGMTAEQMQRLFQPYQQASATTSQRFGGTGLGLAISRQFCRLMGGDLTVASEVGKGSTFTVTLPDHGGSSPG